MRRNAPTFYGNRNVHSFDFDERQQQNADARRRNIRRTISTSLLDPSNRPVIREMLEAGRADIKRTLNSRPVTREILQEIDSFKKQLIVLFLRTKGLMMP